MQNDRALTRWTLALAIGAVGSLAIAPTSVARPDDTHLVQVKAYGLTECPLERIGDQLVRCDNLTGTGVAADWYVPQAH